MCFTMGVVCSEFLLLPCLSGTKNRGSVVPPAEPEAECPGTAELLARVGDERPFSYTQVVREERSVAECWMRTFTHGASNLERLDVYGPPVVADVARPPVRRPGPRWWEGRKAGCGRRWQQV